MWSLFIKRRTNFWQQVVPIWLDFFVVKGKAIIVMQILKISNKITSNKNYQSWIYATIIGVINFKKVKKTLWPLFMDGRRQFTFYH